jgi:hypothetical protein
VPASSFDEDASDAGATRALSSIATANFETELRPSEARQVLFVSGDSLASKRVCVTSSLNIVMRQSISLTSTWGERLQQPGGPASLDLLVNRVETL